MVHKYSRVILSLGKTYGDLWAMNKHWRAYVICNNIGTPVETNTVLFYLHGNLQIQTQQKGYKDSG